MPVDPFQQHRQLNGRQGDLPRFAPWPDEPALLKPFAEQAPALATPLYDLDQSSPPTVEDEYVAYKRILLRGLLGLGCQRREPTPHVGHACSPEPGSY